MDENFQLFDIRKDSFIPDPAEPTEAETELLKEFSETFFDDVAGMLYDIVDLQRQHRNYLENMRILSVPLQPPPSNGLQQDNQSQVGSFAQSRSRASEYEIVSVSVHASTHTGHFPSTPRRSS